MTDPADPIRVLVVDDELPIRTVVRGFLEREGMHVEEAADGPGAVEAARAFAPDIVVLDIMLPGFDGLEVLRRIRTFGDPYVILLTARSEEVDRIVGLTVGADDYLTKPFSVPELLARMRVALRHASGGEAEDAEFRTGALTIDRARRVVRVRGVEVHLTPTEYRLLLTLAGHAGRVLTHRQLLHEVWGPGRVGQDHYLRVYMAQLRAKLELDPARPEYLRTEPGVGYRLVEKDEGT